MESLDQFITQEALRQALGFRSDRPLYKARQLGLPYIKLGQRVFYHLPSVAEWLLTRQSIDRDRYAEPSGPEGPTNPADVRLVLQTCHCHDLTCRKLHGYSPQTAGMPGSSWTR